MLDYTDVLHKYGFLLHTYEEWETQPIIIRGNSRYSDTRKSGDNDDNKIIIQTNISVIGQGLAHLRVLWRLQPALLGRMSEVDFALKHSQMIAFFEKLFVANGMSDQALLPGRAVDVA